MIDVLYPESGHVLSKRWLLRHYTSLHERNAPRSRANQQSKLLRYREEPSSSTNGRNMAFSLLSKSLVSHLKYLQTHRSPLYEFDSRVWSVASPARGPSLAQVQKE